MSEIERYGNVKRTRFDATVKKMGSSHVVLITRIVGMMGLKPGDVVRVTVERLDAEEDGGGE